MPMTRMPMTRMPMTRMPMRAGAWRSPGCSAREGSAAACTGWAMRAHVPKGQHTMVAAAIRQAFLQPDAVAAHHTWGQIADQPRSRWPKLAALRDDSEHDVLAYMAFPFQHRTKLHSTNPLERLNQEVKRRADVVGIFPNEASMARPTMLLNFSGGLCGIGVR
jgi:transposase-like protein